jgi:hypothetical protein
MKYIKVNSTSIECSHPAVDKIWMLGSVGEDNKLIMGVTILTKDGNRAFFDDGIDKNAFEKAEDYLHSLP